ncbi:MAG: hypothetical protein WDZ49_07620 [Litorilinea sp.]
MHTPKFSSATISVLLLALLLSACQPIQPAATASAPNNGSAPVVPQVIRDLEGSYVGAWTVFGLDEEGQVMKLVSWADTIQAENSQIEDDQAYVLTTGEMVFEGGNIPPMTIAGKEGYFLLPDGSLGDYFVETNGQISKSTHLGENVWITVTPASAQDLASYRLPNVASGLHILNKVVTREDGLEIHRITRVTTVNWTDLAGQARSTQFASLEGFHKRQAE